MPSSRRKDRVTPLAIGVALFCVLAAMVLDGGNPAVLIKPAPLILVFGGTFAASIAGIVKSDMKGLRQVLRRAIGSHVPELDSSLKTVIQLAHVSKSKGALEVDRYAKENIDDRFLLTGVELIADGTSSEDIREILEGEIEAMEARHKKGAKFFTDMGGFSPTLGILGTVVGLVHVLSEISTPGALGPGIASAFTATLWGVLAANIIWLPISNKLQRISAAEVQVKLMQTEGLLAIQAGSTSRMVQSRMETFLPAKTRDRIASTLKNPERDAA